MVDLDGDGTNDLISGSWPGQVYLFSGKAKGAGFSAKKVALTDKAGKPIMPGKASAVFAVDWDRDGDIDLLSGNIGGSLVWYENLSGDKAFILGPQRVIKAGSAEIKRVPGGDSAPVVADWDGDGDLDLLTGTGNGDVLLYRNVSKPGAKGAPTLAPAKTLVKGNGHKTVKGRPGSRTKIAVVDYDGDGRLDLLVGDFASTRSKTGRSTYHGNVWFFRRGAVEAKTSVKTPSKSTTTRPDGARDF